MYILKSKKKNEFPSCLVDFFLATRIFANKHFILLGLRDKKAYRPFAEKRDKVGMDDIPHTEIRNACNLVNLLWEYVFGFLIKLSLDLRQHRILGLMVRTIPNIRRLRVRRRCWIQCIHGILCWKESL